MDSVSRPLIALLISTVAAFAVWFVALKPSSSGGGSGTASPGLYTSAIAKAHAAVATSAAASIAHGGKIVTAVPQPSVTTGTQRPAGSTPLQPVAPAGTQPVASAAGRSTTTAAPLAHRSSVSSSTQRRNAVTRALEAKKTLALLFYNSAGADDQAVRAELAAVATRGGRVVKLAVPLGELANYKVVTNQVTVSASPTLVLIDGAHRASTLVGFADRFEIAQRVEDALASP